VVSALLTAERLQRRYGARLVVDVASLELNAGEVLAVVGPNGAGKSTLFRLLLLIERPDAGTIRLAGAACGVADVRARGRLAGVFQRPILFDGTVRDNVAYGLRASRVDRQQRARRVAAALGWLELDGLADAPVHTLSGGEAQRVALARALALEPDVLLLDEPTANLDVTIRRRFRQDVERVARQHARGIILITHDAGEAFGLADRIAVMDGGRMVQSGTPEEIMLRPGTPFVAELTGAELLLHGTVRTLEDGLCAVDVAPGVALWAASAAGAVLAVGARAVVAYRPEDVTLSPAEQTAETSAANVLRLQIDAVVPAGALVRVRLRAAATPALSLTALVTRRSMESLGLAPGAAVTARLKASALHAWGRDD
jgi:tungstate transport system ATP-binding protein